MRQQLEEKLTEWEKQLKEVTEQRNTMTAQLEEVNRLVERITGAVLATQELLKIAELHEPAEQDTAP